MTDRERLIDLIEKFGDDIAFCDICKRPDSDCDGCRNERFADYLIEHGVIALPCKVEDTVYSWKHYWDKEGDIVPYQITNITVTQNKKGVWTKKYRAMQVINGKTIDWQLNFAFDEIGKTVFPTREKAEKALKERESK